MRQILLIMGILVFNVGVYADLRNDILADFLGKSALEEGDRQQALEQMRSIMSNPQSADNNTLQRFLGITLSGEFRRPQLEAQGVSENENRFFNDLQRLRTHYVLELGGIVGADPSIVRTLSLSVHTITHLAPGLFQGLTSLQQLYLDSNHLQTVPANLFQGLINLQKLSLDNNHLQTVPANLFQGLTSLQKLYLDCNPRLQTLPADLFQGLTALQQVHLGCNRLQTIPAGLGQLPHLQLVDCSQNPLETTSAEADFWGISEACTALGDRFAYTPPAQRVIFAPHVATTTETAVANLERSFEDGLKDARLQLPLLHPKSRDNILLWLDAVRARYWNSETEENVQYFSQNLPQFHKKLRVYLQRLFDLPLEEGAMPLWMPQGSNKMLLQRAMAFIFQKLADPSHVYLVDGLLLASELYECVSSCPTGQWEKSQDLLQGLLNLTETSHEERSQEAKLHLWVARFKEEVFKRVVLSYGGVDNTQNVHLLSHYHRALEERLGLSNSGFIDSLHVMGHDPFQGNHWEVARLYYQRMQTHLIPSLVRSFQEKEPLITCAEAISLMRNEEGQAYWTTASPLTDETATLTDLGAMWLLRHINVL